MRRMILALLVAVMLVGVAASPALAMVEAGDGELTVGMGQAAPDDSLEVCDFQVMTSGAP